MYKLIQRKNGKRILLAMFDKKIDAIFEHIKYKRSDWVYLEEVGVK